MAEYIPKPFKAYEGKEPFIFVSYAHADNEEVYSDISQLHNAGYRIWYDEGIRVGVDWPAKIQRVIEECSCFITFLSPEAVESEDVRSEIKIAVDEQKKFLAIHLRETHLLHGLRYTIGARHASYKYKLPGEEYFREIENSLPPEVREETVIYPKGSREADFVLEIHARVREVHGWSNSVRDDLLKFAKDLLSLSAETARRILDETLTRLGINEEYGNKVESLRPLVRYFLDRGEITAERRQILENRAKESGILPGHWEHIVQEEAASKAKELYHQGEVETAKRILDSSVDQSVEQSKEIRSLLGQIEKQREIPHISMPAAQPETESQPVSGIHPSLPNRAITVIGENVPIAWVRVAGGPFLRGCPEDFIRNIERKYGLDVDVYRSFPQREESLDEFWMSLSEITNAHYHAFVRATGHRYPAGWRGTTPPYHPGDNDKPVTGVTWRDSLEFAEWLGARLPTRAEYEKACRGEDGRLFPWGNEFDASNCNTDESGIGRLTSTSAFPAGASPYGVLDLVGNVWEWAADGEESFKMTVGASYERIGEIYGVGFFNVSRAPESSENDLGFRIACSDIRKLMVKRLEFEDEHHVE